MNTFRPILSKTPSLRTRSFFYTATARMQSPLIAGLGPQDHCAIGRAASLPGQATGQYLSVSPITLASPERPLPLQLRVTVPLTGSQLPLILLSHGMGPSNNLSSLNGYAPMAQFYAAHGFAVVQPTHLGSRSLALPKDTLGGPGFERWRVRDMKTVLDQLDAVEAAVPGLCERQIDRARIAVWGHSGGSHTACALLGQRWVDHVEQPGAEIDEFEPRIKAGIVLAAVGRGEVVHLAVTELFPFMKTPKFEHMRTQALIVNGDADASKNLTDQGYRWHADPYLLAPGPKDLVTMFGANHGFGGVSGWDSTDCAIYNEESPEMVAAVQRLTLAYLRSKLYDDDDADWDRACEALAEAKLGTHESK